MISVLASSCNPFLLHVVAVYRTEAYSSRTTPQSTPARFWEKFSPTPGEIPAVAVVLLFVLGDRWAAAAVVVAGSPGSDGGTATVGGACHRPPHATDGF